MLWLVPAELTPPTVTYFYFRFPRADPANPTRLSQWGNINVARNEMRQVLINCNKWVTCSSRALLNCDLFHPSSIKRHQQSRICTSCFRKAKRQTLVKVTNQSKSTPHFFFCLRACRGVYRRGWGWQSNLPHFEKWWVGWLVISNHFLHLDRR